MLNDQRNISSLVYFLDNPFWEEHVSEDSQFAKLHLCTKATHIRVLQNFQVEADSTTVEISIQIML